VSFRRTLFVALVTGRIKCAASAFGCDTLRPRDIRQSSQSDTDLVLLSQKKDYLIHLIMLTYKGNLWLQIYKYDPSFICIYLAFFVMLQAFSMTVALI
jgi:hypothetical protein